MLQFYDIRVENPSLRLFCRVKKHTLTILSECKSVWIKLYWNGDSHLILEECQMYCKPALLCSENVVELLNPCLLLGFYSFPQATEVLLNYGWTLRKDQHGNYENWSIDIKSIHCLSLPKLNLNIRNLEEEEEEHVWEAPEIDASREKYVLYYG